ncbi:MAG: S8 family serine peptidase [Casimicrobiaceae bacterium]
MIFRLVLSFLACWLLTGAATDVLTIDKDPTVVELIVKIDRSAYGEASPALVIASVAKANSGTEILSPIEAALVQRFSTPQSARWLLDHRQPNEYLDSLRKVDPDHPELHLQEFIVLAYTFAQDRMTAHARLATDKAVSSVIDNSRETFSARVNDFYVQSTGPSAAPARYQYGLESMKTMSPYSNPGQLSGWDLAIGYGYVAVVDSGIAPTHGDLQRTFRPHMSQAFYTSACPTSNLTNVDEQGPFLPGSECFSGMVGHGTHVAGIVGASTHNGIGVAGICVDCSLIIAKIRQGNNAFSSSIINGIYHGIIRGAQVINRSGGSYYIEGAHGAGKHNCSDVAGDDGFCLVLALAERREVVLVAASGNNNNATMGTEFPAREPNVVSVAGTTYPNDDLWASDQNPCCAGSDTTKVDFVAPAKRVMSTFYPGGSWAPANCSDILNDGNNGFDECTGTSMAAPHVAATIAVVRSVNPLLSRYAVVDLVRQSARTVAISSTYPKWVQDAESRRRSHRGTLHERVDYTRVRHGECRVFGGVEPLFHRGAADGGCRDHRNHAANVERVEHACLLHSGPKCASGERLRASGRGGVATQSVFQGLHANGGLWRRSPAALPV